MTLLAKLLLANGAARVLAVPVAEGGSYDQAFSLLAAQEGVKVMVCDSEDLTVQQTLGAVVVEASVNRRERIAVVPGGAGETVTQLTQRAKALNRERMVLTAPAALSLMVFCLLYTPCVATISTIRRELGTTWAVVIMCAQCLIAWCCAALAAVIL